MFSFFTFHFNFFCFSLFVHFEPNGFNANNSSNNNITTILISAPLQRLTTFHIKYQVDYYNCLCSAADFVGRPNVLRALNNDYSPHKWTELEVPLPVFSPPLSVLLFFLEAHKGGWLKLLNCLCKSGQECVCECIGLCIRRSGGAPVSERLLSIIATLLSCVL